MKHVAPIGYKIKANILDLQAFLLNGFIALYPPPISTKPTSS